MSDCMTQFDCANEIMREQFVSPSLQDLPRALQELILLYAAPHDPFNMGARKKFGSVLIQVFYCGPNWKQLLGHPLIESVSEKIRSARSRACSASSGGTPRSVSSKEKTYASSSEDGTA